MTKMKSTVAAAMAAAVATVTVVGAVSGPASAADSTVRTLCGPRYKSDGEWLRRCGQAKDGQGRVGVYHASTMSTDWDPWTATAYTCAVEDFRTATDGVAGKVTGFPQFRVSTTGHIYTRGSQEHYFDGVHYVRLGYFDHTDHLFHSSSAWYWADDTLGDVYPSLYPTEQKPVACSVPSS
jgi:hypothetical protein